MTTKEPVRGRAFATLPTDVFTGFPVHVNARWCLMDNRQALQMSRAASHRRMSDFNRILIEDTLAHLWAELLLDVKEIGLDSASFYALWPGAHTLSDPWSRINKTFYTRMHAAESCALLNPGPPQQRFGSTPCSSNMRACVCVCVCVCVCATACMLVWVVTDTFANWK